MSYQEAPATKLLAVTCICCGLPLVDAVSVELGMGPDCRKGIYPNGVSEEDRKEVNKLVHIAAVAAQNGSAQKVLEIAEKIRNCGLDVLANRVARRFQEGARTVRTKRVAPISIEEDGDDLIVKTPFRRKEADEFIEAWRKIRGRRYDGATKKNRVPKSEKEALWSLLKKFFPGKWGTGPKGVFRVPQPPKEKSPKEEPSQPLLEGWEFEQEQNMSEAIGNAE